MANEKFVFIFPSGEKYKVFPMEAQSIAFAVQSFYDEHPEYFKYGENQMYSILVERSKTAEN